ncbi:MAG TPA: PPOX class F420-dependent oxidoreductase [Candidatus Dormibacteraeota bacterium]|nr:PPOX class F420-dependent oxidoreductase [Candidatus Dormibacteraeota bacterium]
MPDGPLPPALRDFLDAANLATVATLGSDGSPQATVVWFLLEGDLVLINTKIGRSKVRNLARDPRVAMAVFDSEDPYRSVQVRGVVEARRDGADASEDIHRLSRRYTGHDYRDPEGRISYLIKVKSWTAYGLPEVG